MKKSLALFFLLVLVMPLVTFAAVPCTANNGKVGPSDLPKCISQIYTWSLGIGSVFAVLMVILGGYYYMTAAGNAEKSSKGTEYIWGAVIGLVILFIAYILLYTINPDLTNFSNFEKDFVCIDDGQCPNGLPDNSGAASGVRGQ